MDHLHFLLIGLVIGLIVAMAFLGRSVIGFAGQAVGSAGCGPLIGLLVFVVIAMFTLGGDGSAIWWSANSY